MNSEHSYSKKSKRKRRKAGDRGIMDSEITGKEVKDAIRRLKRGKAKGTDGIPN